MWDDLIYESLGGPIYRTTHGKHPPRYPVDASGSRNYTLNEATALPPLKFFEAPPCWGKRVPTWSMEIHSERELSIVITQVYSFRDLFESQGIQGGRMGATETSKGQPILRRCLCPSV